MPLALDSRTVSLLPIHVFIASILAPLCSSTPLLAGRGNNSLQDKSEPSSTRTILPRSVNVLREKTYLSVQIGGIIGSYAFALVVVATLLFILSKRRREHLEAGDEPLQEPKFEYALPPQPPVNNFPYPLTSPKGPLPTVSEHSLAVTEGALSRLVIPTGPYSNPEFDAKSPYSVLSFASPSIRSVSTSGVNLLVDQNVVAADKAMAQNQLEEMYKLVLEQEAAKKAGVALDQPPLPVIKPSGPNGILKKDRSKPATLNLENSEKPKSKTASLLSALKSPGRKKNSKAVNISSPISLTPMTGTFPHHEDEEDSKSIPRYYKPTIPPRGENPRGSTRSFVPLTPPEEALEGAMSIDGRMEAQAESESEDRKVSPISEGDPVSAVSEKSERSAVSSVGLPSSPKPNADRFPGLPMSPKPGSTFSRSDAPLSPRPGSTSSRFEGPPSAKSSAFSRPNAPSAVRTGGALPLRAYQTSLATPTVHQTVFEQAPLSPSGLKTPMTGQPVPYTPYQPYTPCIPITPSLITKADRKRMRNLQPKTPTVQMVQNEDDVW